MNDMVKWLRRLLGSRTCGIEQEASILERHMAQRYPDLYGIERRPRPRCTKPYRHTWWPLGGYHRDRNTGRMWPVSLGDRRQSKDEWREQREVVSGD